MLKTLTLLETNPNIKSHSIFDLKSGSDFYFIKAKATLLDDSVIFIKEFFSEKQFIYSFIGKIKMKN